MKKSSRVWFGLLISLAVLPGCGDTQSTEPSGAVAAAVERSGLWSGLWVAEKRFGDWLGGPVSLHRAGSGWVARIQGETLEVERNVAADGSVSWEFSFFEAGRFVGWQERPDRAIQGHWLQAPGTVEVYPFATPVRLQPAGSRHRRSFDTIGDSTIQVGRSPL